MADHAMDIARGLGIRTTLRRDCPDIQGSLLLNENEDDVLIVMNNAEEARHSDLHIGRDYRACRSLIDRAAQPMENNTLSLTFKPLETKVFRLSK